MFVGFRAVFSNGVFSSRLGNVFYAPPWFSADLPKSVALDGELWMKPGAFRETSCIVKKQKQTDEQAARWKQLTFQVFDTVDDATPEYKDRYAWLRKNLRKSTYGRVVKQEQVRDTTHLDEMLKAALAAGQEGVMLRNPLAPYEHKRSHNLLKVKVFHDTEALVTGYEAGKGRNSHVMGALLCVLPNGVTFGCGTGFTDAERANPPPISTVVTVKYQELDAKSGRPRFPTYVRDRDASVTLLTWDDVVAQYRKDHPGVAIVDAAAAIAAAASSSSGGFSAGAAWLGPARRRAHRRSP